MKDFPVPLWPIMPSGSPLLSARFRKKVCFTVSAVGTMRQSSSAVYYMSGVSVSDQGAFF
jgi:hypothetical protein